MPTDETWRRYLDAGAEVGQVTLAKAQEIAKGLLASDETERERARRDLDDLGRVGRRMGEQLVDLARREFGKQLQTVGSFDDLLDRIGDLLGSTTPDPAASTENPPIPASEVPAPEGSDGPTGTQPLASGPEPKTKKQKKAKETGEARGGSKKHKKQRQKAKSAKGRPEAPTPNVLTLAAPVDPAGRH